MAYGKSLVATLVVLALPWGCRSSRDAPEPPPGSAPPSASARAGAPSVAPSAAAASPLPAPLAPNVEAIVRSQIEPEATRCFEKGLKAAPQQAGGLLLMVKVKPDGKVDTVSAAADGALSVDTVDCIQWVAKRAEFDPPGGDAGTTHRVLLTFPH